MSSTRQLAAIMFTDIVGYTALMQEDEKLALKLRNRLQKKLEEELNLHNGRILEWRGDGALCSFNSAIEGVKAALALQLEMQSSPQVPLRIGIHTGDIIIEGSSVYGDGVNIASRLESFAISGSILISGKVYDDIKNQDEIQSVSLGKYRLKNVKEAVEIFALSNPGIKIPDAYDLEGKGEKVQSKSLLVLPFVNMSNDPEQEYFSDGLTEELISNLARLKDMKIISRTTSMQYKGTKKDAKTIGREAGVSYILEGSVRKQGNNLRITSQFVDAYHDTHLWAETYHGTMEDIFDIQEKVSSRIIDALRLQLSGKDKQSLNKRSTINSEAYQFYLQGRFFWNRRNEMALRTATRYFEKALEKDRDYALAWAGLADTYSLMGEYTNISRKELLPKQLAAVNKALAIDSQLAEAHISLAVSLMLNDWDWDNSKKEFKIGIELNPNYATGRHWYAQWLLYNGSMEQAYREINLAVKLDPVSQGILKDLGIHLYYNKRYDEAIDAAMKSMDLDPDFVPAHRLLSLAYQGKGMIDSAIAENRIWGELTGSSIKTNLALAHIYASAEQKEEARKILKDIGTQEMGDNDFRNLALVYTALGEYDKAFESLDKSYEKHEESLCTLKIDHKLEPLRSDPRFGILLKKIGLEG